MIKFWSLSRKRFIFLVKRGAGSGSLPRYEAWFCNMSERFQRVNAQWTFKQVNRLRMGSKSK